MRYTVTCTIEDEIEADSYDHARDIMEGGIFCWSNGKYTCEEITEVIAIPESPEA